jgi:parallel beta-helix repeat protein
MLLHDDSCKVSGNTIRANGEWGILVLPAAGNSIHGNSVTGNDVGNSGTFDMGDLSADCGTNKWTGNTFGTSNDPCIN